MQRYVVSKRLKTAQLLKSDTIKAHIPKTVPMTSESLLAMLNEFRMVYIKPNSGTFGIGVMRVEWNPGKREPYHYQLGEALRSFVHYDSMFQEIKQKTGQKNYLVQKGIHLLKYQNRRFDMRIMVQKNLNNVWETTGWIGRVAHPRKIVTNYHSGGTLKSVESLLKPYLKPNERTLFLGKLRKFGVVVAKQLHKGFPGIKEIGIDIALDTEMMPWILEVNTKPDPYIFRILDDKAIFSRMMRYERSYRKV